MKTRRPGITATLLRAGMAAGLAAATALAGCANDSPPPLAIGAESARAAVSGDALSIDGAFQPISGYRVSGSLPTEPDEAAVLRWQADPAPEAAVQALAAALGFGAAPTLDGSDWTVTEDGAQLLVYGAAGNPWVYVRADRADCPPLPLDGWSGPSTAISCDVATPADPASPAPPPIPNEQVQSLAAPVFTAVGLTLPPTAVTDTGTVAVDPDFDGLPSRGAATTVSVSVAAGDSAASVESATGWLGTPAPADRYPLITAAAGAEQLKNLPMPAMPELCRTDLPDCGVLPPREVVITGAELGWLFTWEGEQPLLAPAWHYAVADTGPGPVVIAVTPEYLVDPAPQPEPTGVGSAEPGSPGTAPSAGVGTSGEAAPTS